MQHVKRRPVDVQPVDPTTIVSVVILLTLTAAAAVAGPVLRAIPINPAVARRNE
jgi:hypothetical protein